jgi:hypothetical protein
MPALTHHK